MRRYITFVLCVIITAILLSGCNLLARYRMLHERISINWSSVEQAADKLTSVLDSADAESLKKMFSYNTQVAVDSLDGQVKDLLDFYEGGSTTYEIKAGPIESKHVSYGIVEEYFQVSIILTTATQQYCVAFQSYTRDDADENNVGITSLYIAKKEDVSAAFAYWGDGEWREGITILYKD